MVISISNTTLPFMFFKYTHRKTSMESSLIVYVFFVSEELIQPEMITSYMTGEKAALAKEILQGKREDLPIRQRHASVRNYIMLNMLLHNGARSGVIINLKMGQYYSAKKRGPIDGNYVIHITKHKTLESHGAAQIVLPEELFQCLSTYLDLRKELPCFTENMCMDDSPFLLNYSGKGLSHTDVSNQLTNEFADCNTKANRISCRIIRKAAVTHVSTTRASKVS